MAGLLSSLGVHLQELRARVRVVFLSFLVIFLVLVIFPANPAQAFQDPGQYLTLVFLEHTVVAEFLHGIVSYILPQNWTLIGAAGIGEGMEIYFVAALVLAVTIDMPVIAYETYKFVDPALKDEERKLVYPFIAATSVLFAAGILFGFFVLAKFLVIALAPFYVASQISFQVDAAAFYYVTLLIIGSTGVAFTSPVFVYSLIRLRVVGPDAFSKNRVVIWFALWVVTGLFLTPDGGPLLDLVLFIPIVAMVEAAVWLGRRSVRADEPRGTQAGPAQGGTTRREVKCPYCGMTLSRPMLFCEHCGRSVA